MNILKKLMSVCLVALAVGVTPLCAQDETDGLPDAGLTHSEQDNPHSGYGVEVTNFVAVPMCYVGGHNLFVVIDSIDNSVDIIMRPDMDTVRFLTDEALGRHDLVNILRPVSVGFYDGYAVVLASSKKDSSYLAILDPTTGELVNRVDFNCRSYAFDITPEELIVVGRNQQGYDINILDIKDGIENISNNEDCCQRVHYHKPKQADRIQQSDPIGLGLTMAAVSVVFLALLCISLILKGYGKLIVSAQDRKANKATQTPAASPSASQTSGEVYAAIAAAIFLYDDELHDEEDTVITIHKVERAWTPWTPNYKNINLYLNNRI